MNASLRLNRRPLTHIWALFWRGGRSLSLLAGFIVFGLAFVGSTAPAQTVIATVPVGTTPDAIAVNPVTNQIYVANMASNTVTEIDGATNATTTLPVGMGPNFIAVNSVTNKIYVANGGESTVTVIDGATHTTTTVNVALGPIDIAVNSVTNKVYVVDVEGNNAPAALTEIDGSTNAVTVVLTSSQLAGVAVNSATNMIYASEGVDSIWVVNGATNAFIRLSLASGSFVDPYALAVNMVTNQIYVTNSQSNDGSGTGNVSVIDGLTNAITTVPDNITQGFFSGFFQGIAVNPVTDQVYFLNAGTTVSDLDGGTNTISTIPVGGGANVAVNPVTNLIYVDSGSGVSVINGLTHAVATVTDPLANNPDTMAVNAVTGRVYVANYSSNNVTVIGEPASAPPPSGPPPNSARLINISTRAQVGTGANILIPGFVIGGSGTETLLIRADGPALTAFGVAGALAQPSLSVFNSTGTVIASNTGWGTNSNPAQIASAAASVGAFALASGSADCALVASLTPGAYTVQVSGVGNSTGVALAEVYEVSSSGTRLANISTRALVGTGANIIIPGFVIAGSGSDQLLARGDGPALTGFGVGGALAQPSLGVFNSSGNMIASNTGWGTNSNPTQLASAAATVGAFALASGSADSALIVNLSAGAYTMQLSGVNSSTGVALAELYEVP
jgi:YVTN family beta-propeller protein